MQQPFIPFHGVHDVNAHHYKLYNHIEKVGFKHNDYGLEATIQNGDPLIISFKSIRNETGDQSAYLNPVLWAEYAGVTDQTTSIKYTIQSSAWIMVLAGVCVCALLYHFLTGMAENAVAILINMGFLIVVAAADIYMRTTLLSRFLKWMNKAAAFSA